MAFRVKIYILLLAFIILLTMGSSSGLDGPNPDLVLHKLYKTRLIEFYSMSKLPPPVKRDDEETIRSRKLLEVDVATDYDDVCANPKHDPRKKPGCKNIP